MVKYAFYVMSILDSEFNIIESYVNELNHARINKIEINHTFVDNEYTRVIIVHNSKDKAIINSFLKAFNKGFFIRFYYNKVESLMK